MLLFAAQFPKTAELTQAGTAATVRRTPMAITTPSVRLNYQEVQDLVKKHQGTMEWKVGGAGGGGTWELRLEGRLLTVRIQDGRSDIGQNALDLLYDPATNPTSPSLSHKLWPDAFWRLMQTFLTDGS
jgi:hypothetical protein